MRHERIPLGGGASEGFMDTYLLDRSPELPRKKGRPAMVICPGGGYCFTSDREAEPVAVRFASLGFQSFVVRYSVAPARFPTALFELSRAVAEVRNHAGEWDVDPERIIVCGFSAGGHLAGSLGMFWNRDFVKSALGFSGGENRPNGLVLCYPVISSGEYGHADSFRCLLGDRYEELKASLSLENQVSQDTPPVFLWHTDEDDLVPPENSLLLSGALRRAGIPQELHLFPRGGHGLSLCTEESGPVQPTCAIWPDLAADWVRQL